MTDSPRAIAQRIDLAFHARDIDALAAFWADDIDYATPDVSLVGKPGRRAAEEALLHAFPDARISERGFVESGEFIVIEGAMSGTQLGPLRIGGALIPPTGRTILSDYAALLWFRNGKVARQRLYFDRLALARQLGLAPSAGQDA